MEDKKPQIKCIKMTIEFLWNAIKLRFLSQFLFNMCLHLSDHSWEIVIFLVDLILTDRIY